MEEEEFKLEPRDSPPRGAFSAKDLPDENLIINKPEHCEPVAEQTNNAMSQEDALQSEQKVQSFLQMIEQKVQLQLLREQLSLDSEENSTAIDSDEDFVSKLLAEHSTELEQDEPEIDDDLTPRESQQLLNEPIDAEPAKEDVVSSKHITWESEKVPYLLEDKQDVETTMLGCRLEELPESNQPEAEVEPEMESNFVDQLLVDISLPTTEISESMPTSDAELKQNELQETEESLSCETYISELPNAQSATQQQLNESFRLLEVIDTSGTINVNWLEDQEARFQRKLLSLLLNGESFDIKVYIGAYKFHCHLAILQLYSSRFVPNPTQTPYRVRLPEDQVTPDAFNAIYNWMTYDKPMKLKQYNKRNLIEFYKAVKYLNIPELNDSVCNALDKIKHEAEAFTMLLDFTQLGLMDFEVLFLSRISRFFLTIVSSLEFVEMSPRYVCQLLGSNFLGVNSEIEIFYAGVRWLSHAWPERQSHVQDVISCVRFGLLPPMFLRFLQVPQNTQVMDSIASSQLVKDLINKAFVRFATAELYAQHPKDQLMIQLPEYVATEPRKWLYDPKCAYHHTFACNLRQFFTYEQFLAYLELLHHSKPDEWQGLEYLSETISCCPR